MILDLDKFYAECGATNNAELIFALRLHYGGASAIASLASTELRSEDPERLAYCDQEMAWFFDDLGNCFYDCWSGVVNALSNGDRLASEPTTGDLRGSLKGVPAIVLGAGPGVSPRWDLIKASRGHAVLIVCDVMVRACVERGIVPDFVSAQERLPLVYESMQGIDKAGMTLLAPPVIEKRVVDDFGGRVVWCWRGCGMELWMNRDLPRNNFGRSCGVQGIGAALLAGCSPIYLVGHDLAMSDGATHCADADSATKATGANIDQDNYHTRIPALSITGRPVSTIHLWQMFKQDIEHIINEHSAQVINTGDGLPIHGTRAGELPSEWNEYHLGGFVPRRRWEVRNPRDMIPVMLADIPKIRTAFEAVMVMEKPNADGLVLSKIADPLTAGLWTEIFGSTYAAAKIRLHIDPTQHLAMLKRVANVVLHTLPHIESGLRAL